MQVRAMLLLYTADALYTAAFLVHSGEIDVWSPDFISQLVLLENPEPEFGRDVSPQPLRFAQNGVHNLVNLHHIF